MTVNKTISLPDDLDSLIENFNRKHPYEKLNISQIAQKAIYQKISNEDPELVLKVEKIKNEIRSNVENENATKVANEISSTEKIKPVQKPIINQHTLEMTCIECGKPFTAERKTRKFCSGKCKTAHGRKSKNPN